MEIVAAAGGGAFVLASLVLGLRLLALAARTRRLPELAMGGALLLTGAVGYPLNAAARSVPGLDDDVRGLLIAAYMATQALGITALAVFDWRVFRPRSRGALAATACVAALYAVAMLGQARAGGGFAGAADDPSAPWPGVGSLLAIGVLVWSCWESWRWFALLRRRARLGLADPLVTDRFRLWALGAGAAALLTAIAFVTNRMGIDFVVWAPGALLIGVLGLGAAGAIALAFVPPPAYRRRVESWARS
jgi:hypothetical protein